MEKPKYNNDLETSYFSFGDIVALGLMISTGLYFIVISSFRIAVMIYGTIESIDLFLNILSSLVGYGLIYSAYRYVKRSSFLKAMADNIFVETIYDRLEPILEDIAETKTDYDLLNERIDYLNFNVDDIRKSIEIGKNNPSNTLVPVQYAIKNITHQYEFTMLTTITLGLFIFMQNNPGSFLPYVSPLTYILWWGLITSHHDLWEEPKAWYWVSVPILLVPMITILAAALFSAASMFATLYVGLGIYTLLYYMWSEYSSRGIFPFGMGERVRDLKEMIKKAEVVKEKSQERKPKIILPSYFGTILIILSILVFAFSITGYIIENNILDISWQMIGLDISWQPLYSYGLIILGLLLLITGYFFVVKFRRYR